jgi:hypothetical protein
MRSRYAIATALAVALGCAADVAPIDPACPVGDLDRAACESAGGFYGVGLHEQCYCATGDTLQRCTRAEDCAYGCVKPLNGGACATATVGVCLDYRPVTGCACFLGKLGDPNVDICAR